VDAHKGSQEVYSKKVKAGKRTYFFDVKATRANDYYLTITESKKHHGDENKYEKHKIFLYKEDLNKFLEALHNTTEHIKKELLPHYDFNKFSEERPEESNAFPRRDIRPSTRRA